MAHGTPTEPMKALRIGEPPALSSVNSAIECDFRSHMRRNDRQAKQPLYQLSAERNGAPTARNACTLHDKHALSAASNGALRKRSEPRRPRRPVSESPSPAPIEPAAPVLDPPAGSDGMACSVIVSGEARSHASSLGTPLVSTPPDVVVDPIYKARVSSWAKTVQEGTPSRSPAVRSKGTESVESSPSGNSTVDGSPARSGSSTGTLRGSPPRLNLAAANIKITRGMRSPECYSPIRKTRRLESPIELTLLPAIRIDEMRLEASDPTPPAREDSAVSDPPTTPANPGTAPSGVLTIGHPIVLPRRPSSPSDRLASPTEDYDSYLEQEAARRVAMLEKVGLLPGGWRAGQAMEPAEGWADPNEP